MFIIAAFKLNAKVNHGLTLRCNRHGECSHLIVVSWRIVVATSPKLGEFFSIIRFAKHGHDSTTMRLKYLDLCHETWFGNSELNILALKSSEKG
jgi:hypothetical protein